MKITRVVKKDDKNVVIYFDNEGKLFLSYEIFLKNGLKKNDEISESRFSFLVEQNQLYFLKQKAFHYLGRRHHSAFELKLKLRQKGYEQRFIDQVIDEIKSSGYLDDYEFGALFAEENIKNKFWGKKKVESELFKKGVDRETIGRILEEKFPEGNELENALALGRKKIKSLQTRKTESEKVKAKLYSFLLARGYDYDTCKRTVEILISE